MTPVADQLARGLTLPWEVDQIMDDTLIATVQIGLDGSGPFGHKNRIVSDCDTYQCPAGGEIQLYVLLASNLLMLRAIFRRAKRPRML